MKYDKESYFDISELYIFVGGPNLCYKVEDEKRVGVYRYYDILTDKLVLKLNYVPTLTLERVLEDLNIISNQQVCVNDVLNLMPMVFEALPYYSFSSDFGRYVYKRY